MVSLLLAVIYAAFISLGLPDALLGSAWPIMHVQMNVPLSYAGIVTFVIAMGTVVSALVSDRLTLKLGAGKVTALSVSLTALALLGFSVSNQYWMLLLFAIPYGLGAGSVDAALNNYVALHYSSRHMSWLHCMWGVGCSIGPSIMSWALAGGSANWPMGYRVVGLLQLGLTALIVLSLPIWKGRSGTVQAGKKEEPVRPMSIAELVKLPGAKEIMVTSSATARWNPPQVCGHPPSWCFITSWTQRLPQPARACSTSASLQGEQPTGSLRIASTIPS